DCVFEQEGVQRPDEFDVGGPLRLPEELIDGSVEAGVAPASPASDAGAAAAEERLVQRVRRKDIRSAFAQAYVLRALVEGAVVDGGVEGLDLGLEPDRVQV